MGCLRLSGWDQQQPGIGGVEVGSGTGRTGLSPCSSPLHHCLLPARCGMGTDTSTQWRSLVPTGGFLSKYRTWRVSLSVSKQEFRSVCDPLCCAPNRLNMYVFYIIEKHCDLDGCTLFPSFVSTIKYELLDLLVPSPTPILNHYHIIRTLYGALSIKPNIEKITDHLVQMESTVNDLENMCQTLKLSNTF